MKREREVDSQSENRSERMPKSMSMSPELSRETVTPEKGSAFGFKREELVGKLKEDEEFAKVFMEQYKIVEEIVKEYHEHEKTTKKRARDDAAHEKEKAERARLQTVIMKIQEKDTNVILEPESAGVDFFEGSSIKYLKEWVKKYRASVKEAKAAEKKAKQQAKEAKEAVKQAKAQAKHDKQIAQMEKMEANLKKWNDQVEFEVVTVWDIDSHVTNDDFAKMKSYHTRVKLLMQLAKFAENVEGVPEYDVESISDDDLKEMHTRCKLLNQLYNLNAPLDYGTEMPIEALKAAVEGAKNAPVPAEN